MVKIGRNYFECTCGDFSHLFVVKRSEHDELDFYPSLNHHLNFFQRVLAAARYVFKKEKLPYASVGLDRENCARLKQVIEDYLKDEVDYPKPPYN